MLSYLKGPVRFVLAGSGHIAGVVNPPAAGKYQYWAGAPAASLADFLANAEEHPGSWWTDWLQWLREQAPETVPAEGKWVPGGRDDKVLEDAPGTYVAMR